MTGVADGGVVRDAGRKAAGHPWFHRLSRAGLVARGFLYVLIGVLALQIALGDGGAEADRTGALTTVAGEPGGTVVLWLMTAGFAALALWQFAEAVYGRPVPDGHRVRERLASAGRGVLYGAGFAAMLAFMFGHRGASGDERSRTFTARLLGEPGGRWLVLGVAAGFLAVGAYVLYGAARRTFLDELKAGQMGRNARRVVEPLGVLGNAARGLVIGAAGVFLGYAAIAYDPGKARGLDGTLREFAGTPAGAWGLVAIACGVVLFGVYSCCEARWRKVEAVRQGR
ncbi:hypothetical protein BJF79_23955 [Actinomadura sp. CNU-125]|uniref:DUF1206 domain-containing protein n=1 Tax=Actinomadura sp. CNU-125 TaxID=1904961 RepID=UPI000960BC09|nr:DUF1206 domain-containing protein [Actinomadura sp. CNU-125]OLT11541.1 hypothetical protein BJF79_23955 [Actinomadura sp. CNU-125]